MVRTIFGVYYDPNPFNAATALVFQADGRIVAAGHTAYNGENIDFALARYNIDGSLDTSLNNSGMILTDLSCRDILYSIAIQRDGRLVAVGDYATGCIIRVHDDFDFALARYSSSSNVFPASDVNVKFSHITHAGYTVASSLLTSQLPELPYGFIKVAQGPQYDTRTSASYVGSVTVTFTIPNITSRVVCDSLKLLRFDNGAWRSDGNGTPSWNPDTQTCIVSQTAANLSLYTVAQGPFTAANVSISGRVLTRSGRGVRGAAVTLTDQLGHGRRTRTGAFGRYKLDNVPAGETYIISVRAKRYRFESRIINVEDEITNLDFIAVQ